MSVEEETKPGELARSLFIGLGGSGHKTIIDVMRSVKEVFGGEHLPQEVQFIAFDTADPETAKTSVGESVAFGSGDFIPVRGAGAATLVKHGGELWWSDKWNKDLPYEGPGAKQKRAHGRAKLAREIGNVRSALKRKIDDIRSANTGFRTARGLRFGPGLAINIVCSLAGGTGAGMWYDIVNLVHDILAEDPPSERRIRGIFYTGDVFDTASEHTENVMGNSFACLRELQDFLEGASETEPYKINQFELRRPGHAALFEEVYLVQKYSRLSNAVRSTSDLFRAVARFLVLTTGPLGTVLGQKFDNDQRYRKDVASMTTGSETRRAMFLGLGVSEIVVDRENIRKSRNEEQAADVLDAIAADVPKGWSSSTGVKSATEVLAQLIPSLLSDEAVARQRQSFEVPGMIEKTTFSSTYQDWETNLQTLGERIRKHVAKSQGEVGDAVTKKIIGQLTSMAAGPSGLAKAISVGRLLCKDLEQDIRKNREIVDARRQTVESLNRENKQAKSSFATPTFGWKNYIEQQLTQLSSRLVDLLQSLADLFRHTAATSILTEIASAVKRKCDDLDALQRRLLALASKLHVAAQRTEQRADEVSLFCRNVTPAATESIEDDSLVTSIIAGLEQRHADGRSWIDVWIAPNSENTIITVIKELVDEGMSSSTKNLTIETWMENESRQQLQQAFAEVSSNAAPMWRYREEFSEQQKPLEHLIIGVPDETAVKAEHRELIIKAVSATGFNTLPTICSTGDPRRISVVRIESAIPAFMLANYERMRSAYEKGSKEIYRVGFHIDSAWQQSLLPLAPDGFVERLRASMACAWALELIREDRGKVLIANSLGIGKTDLDDPGIFWHDISSQQIRKEDLFEHVYDVLKGNRRLGLDLIELVDSQLENRQKGMIQEFHTRIRELRQRRKQVLSASSTTDKDRRERVERDIKTQVEALQDMLERLGESRDVEESSESSGNDK